MNISIVIATFNRAAEVRLTLSSLTKLQPAAAVDYEILVVCNNCQDHTEAVVAEMAPLFAGRLRCVSESKQGLSHARNRGITEAKYEVIAFLDDDVEVDPNWLIAMTNAFGSGDYAAVGGRASLIFPGARPLWLGESDEGYLTKVELGDGRRAAAADELFGLNLAIRLDWLQRVGLFRSDLGRQGTCLLGSEEGELLERIDAVGGKLLYDPLARVEHRVFPQRLSRQWFWSRAYWGQRGEAIRMPDREVTAYGIARVWWWSIRELPTAFSAILFRGVGSEKFFHHVGKLAGRLGLAVGMTRRFPHRFGKLFTLRLAEASSI